VTEPLDPGYERAALDLLLRGFKLSRVLCVIADLEIADRVPTNGSVATADLASAVGVQLQPLGRLLRAAAAFEVFRFIADGYITHTPRSLLLRTDAPNSLHYAARFWTLPSSWQSWGMLDAALTGGVPHEAAWGMSRFDYLRAHPEEARLFDAMMAHFPDNRHTALSAAYDFSGARLICDVGGGNGETLRHILARFPEPRGLIFDLADVVRAIPPDRLLGERITVAPGSFLDGIPAGADLYLLVRVLHNWSDTDCLRILRACAVAMRPESLLLIGEQILEPDPVRGDPTDYLLDIQMMAMFGGARSRTEDEFRSLLAEAGLTLRRVIPTRSSPVSIIECSVT
jgi:hypothetical protein